MTLKHNGVGIGFPANGCEHASVALDQRLPPDEPFVRWLGDLCGFPPQVDPIVQIAMCRQCGSLSWVIGHAASAGPLLERVGLADAYMTDEPDVGTTGTKLAALVERELGRHKP